jgi:lysyl-tRNA synthetase class 2
MFHECKNNFINWQPTSTLENLRFRAEVLHRIRRFFSQKEVLEVETPTLSRASALDPHLYSLRTKLLNNQTLYMQTSPEFAMKRLLAAGSGSIYQIAKAFRDDEIGQRHNPEFTLLEWYRLDFNHHQLMDEVAEFLHQVGGFKQTIRKSYQAIFYEHVQIDPFVASVPLLEQCAITQGITPHDLADADKDTWLHLILSHVIEPKLGNDNPVFIYDFPASQAALSKIRHETYPVAERFELFIHGMEIANGFNELTDAKEQRSRFLIDLEHRNRLGLPTLPMDEYLLAALDHGLPECAGVALGIDRLLMAMTRTKYIKEVMSFSVENA